MPNLPISGLPAATDFDRADLLPLVQGGVTRQLPLGDWPCVPLYMGATPFAHTGTGFKSLLQGGTGSVVFPANTIRDGDQVVLAATLAIAMPGASTINLDFIWKINGAASNVGDLAVYSAAPGYNNGFLKFDMNLTFYDGGNFAAWSCAHLFPGTYVADGIDQPGNNVAARGFTVDYTISNTWDFGVSWSASPTLAVWQNVSVLRMRPVA